MFLNCIDYNTNTEFSNVLTVTIVFVFDSSTLITMFIMNILQGHVGIVLAFLFPSCRIVIIENKEESLDRARRRVRQLKLNNTIIYQCNLQNYK